MHFGKSLAQQSLSSIPINNSHYSRQSTFGNGQQLGVGKDKNKISQCSFSQTSSIGLQSARISNFKQTNQQQSQSQTYLNANKENISSQAQQQINQAKIPNINHPTLNLHKLHVRTPSDLPSSVYISSAQNITSNNEPLSSSQTGWNSNKLSTEKIDIQRFERNEPENFSEQIQSNDIWQGCNGNLPTVSDIISNTTGGLGLCGIQHENQPDNITFRKLTGSSLTKNSGFQKQFFSSGLQTFCDQSKIHTTESTLVKQNLQIPKPQYYSNVQTFNGSQEKSDQNQKVNQNKDLITTKMPLNYQFNKSNILYRQTQQEPEQKNPGQLNTSRTVQTNSLQNLQKLSINRRKAHASRMRANHSFENRQKNIKQKQEKKYILNEEKLAQEKLITGTFQSENTGTLQSLVIPSSISQSTSKLTFTQQFAGDQVTFYKRGSSKNKQSLGSKSTIKLQFENFSIQQPQTIVSSFTDASINTKQNKSNANELYNLKLNNSMSINKKNKKNIQQSLDLQNVVDLNYIKKQGKKRQNKKKEDIFNQLSEDSELSIQALDFDEFGGSPIPHVFYDSQVQQQKDQLKQFDDENIPTSRIQSEEQMFIRKIHTTDSKDCENIETNSSFQNQEKGVIKHINNQQIAQQNLNSFRQVVSKTQITVPQTSNSEFSSPLTQSIPFSKQEKKYKEEKQNQKKVNEKVKPKVIEDDKFQIGQQSCDNVSESTVTMSRSLIHQQQIDLHAMGIINAQLQLNRQENLKNKRLQSDLSIDAGPINILLAEEDSQAQLSHYTARNYLMGLTQDTPDSFRFTSQSMIPKMGNKNSDKNESQNVITFADELNKMSSLVYQNSNHTTKLIEERLKSDENKQPLHLSRQKNNNFPDGVSSFVSAVTMNMNQRIDNDQEEVILSPALGYYANMLPSSSAVTASRKQIAPINQELTFSINSEKQTKLESQINKTLKGSFYPALSEIEQNIIKSKNNLHQYKTNFAPHLNLPNKKLNNFIMGKSDTNQILDTRRISKSNDRTESGNNTVRNVRSRTCPCCNYQQDTKETTQEDDEHHLKGSVHEALYRKGLQKIELLEKICQQRKQELLQKEIEGCIFSPQLQKPSLTNFKASASNLLVPDTARDRQSLMDKGLISSRSTGEKLNDKEVLKDWQESLRQGNEQSNQSIQGEPIKSKLSKFLNPIQKQQKPQLNSTVILKQSIASVALSSRVRSPERFYADMIKFKDTKEARLQRKREQLDQEQKQLSKKAFSSDEEQQNFFEKLSQKKVNEQKSINKLRSSSQGYITNRKDLCINIKNLTYQSPAHLIAQKRGFLLKNHQSKNKLMKSQVFKPEIDSVISSKRLKSQKVEMRRAKQLSEQLYDDYFQRNQRRKLLEKQEHDRLAEEVNRKLNKMHQLSQPDRILANKIALRCKSLYDSMFQFILKEIKVSQRANQQIQKEQDNEQCANIKMTEITADEPKLDQAFSIEGIIIEETSKEALSSATAKNNSSAFVYNNSLQGSSQADIQQQEIQCEIPAFTQLENKYQSLDGNQSQKVDQFIVEIQGIPFQYFLHIMATLNYLSEPTVQIVKIIRELVRANIQKQQESENQQVVSLLMKLDQIYQENQNIVLPELILLQQAWSIVSHPQQVPKQALRYNPIHQENETQMIFGVLTQAFGEQNCIDMLLTQQNMHALNSNCFKDCKDEQQANIFIVNLRNLIVFLIGIENILVENMTYEPSLNIKEDSIVIQKQYGFFISQLFFIKDNTDCQKLSLHFQKFVVNKTFKDREQQIKQKDARLTSHGVITSGSHQPQINQKSKKIAERLYGFLFKNPTETELNSARTQLFCEDNKSLIRKRVGTKYEDFLIEKGKQQMMKRKRLGEEQKELLPEECTFYPKINQKKIKKDLSKSQWAEKSCKDEVAEEEVMNFGIF